MYEGREIKYTGIVRDIYKNKKKKKKVGERGKAIDRKREIEITKREREKEGKKEK